MTEEVNQEIVDIAPEEGSNEPEQQLDPTEARALEMGWRPKEEFDGAEEDFIDAKEFVRRKPLFDKIGAQSKELKAVRNALEAFKEHYGKVQQTEYARALNQLKQTQKQALTDGDIERYHELTEAREAVEQEARQLDNERKNIVVQDPVAPHPTFQAWVQRNQWYETQPHMQVYADNYGKQLAAQGIQPDEVLKMVESEVRKEFPNKFRNPNKDIAPDVSGKGRVKSTATGTRGDSYELSEQERNIMNTLVRGGHITKEKYIADLKAAKGQ